MRIFERTQSLHGLYNAAAWKLLRDCEVAFGPEDLGPFDFEGALKRVKRGER
jgi:hypothetical protein